MALSNRSRLAGDDRADFAQIFADGFDFERRAHQKFEIRLQIADLVVGLGVIEPLANKVKEAASVASRMRTCDSCGCA